MIYIRQSILFKTVSRALVMAMLVLDISWAHPSDFKQYTDNLAPEYLCQQKPMSEAHQELQENKLNNADLIYAIKHIGKFCFGSGQRMITTEALQRKLSYLPGVIIAEDSLAEDKNSTYAKIASRYMKGIGVNGITCDANGLISIPYDLEKTRYDIYLSAKDNPEMKNIQGIAWEIDDRYMVKITGKNIAARADTKTSIKETKPVQLETEEKVYSETAERKVYSKRTVFSLKVVLNIIIFITGIFVPAFSVRASDLNYNVSHDRPVAASSDLDFNKHMLDLNSSNAFLRQMGAKGLLEYKEAALPVLKEAANSKNIDIRRNAQKALKKLEAILAEKAKDTPRQENVTVEPPKAETRKTGPEFPVKDPIGKKYKYLEPLPQVEETAPSPEAIAPREEPHRKPGKIKDEITETPLEEPGKIKIDGSEKMLLRDDGSIAFPVTPSKKPQAINPGKPDNILKNAPKPAVKKPIKRQRAEEKLKPAFIPPVLLPVQPEKTEIPVTKKEAKEDKAQAKVTREAEPFLGYKPPVSADNDLRKQDPIRYYGEALLDKNKTDEERIFAAKELGYMGARFSPNDKAKAVSYLLKGEKSQNRLIKSWSSYSIQAIKYPLWHNTAWFFVYNPAMQRIYASVSLLLLAKFIWDKYVPKGIKKQGLLKASVILLGMAVESFLIKVKPVMIKLLHDERGSIEFGGKPDPRSGKPNMDKQRATNICTTLKRHNVRTSLSLNPWIDIVNPEEAEFVQGLIDYRSIFSLSEVPHEFGFEDQCRRETDSTKIFGEEIYGADKRTLHLKILISATGERYEINLASEETRKLFTDESSVLYRVVKNMNPEYVSIHISASCEERSFGDETRHFEFPVNGSQPLPREELLDRFTQRIKTLQSNLKKIGYDKPVLIEQLDYNPSGAYEHITEPSFIRELLKRTGAGLLFDCSHALVAAKNSHLNEPGYDFMNYIKELIDEDTVGLIKEIHLNNSGYRSDGSAFDSHAPFYVMNETAQDTRKILKHVFDLRKKAGIIERVIINFESDGHENCVKTAVQNVKALADFLDTLDIVEQPAVTAPAVSQTSVAESMAKVIKAASTIQDFVTKREERDNLPKKVDLLLVMGSGNENVALGAAKLFLQDTSRFKYVVCSGRAEEIENFTRIMQSMMSEESMRVLESKFLHGISESAHMGDNLAKVVDLLRKEGKLDEVNSVAVIPIPEYALQAEKTFTGWYVNKSGKQAAEKCYVYAPYIPDISSDTSIFEFNKNIDEELLALDKLKDFTRRKWIEPVDIPDNVLAAERTILSERIKAAAIALAMKAEQEGEELTIGLETDWVPEPGYGEGKTRLKDPMKDLMDEIENLPQALKELGYENVKLVHKKKKDSAQAWLDEVVGAGNIQKDLSNTIFLVSKQMKEHINSTVLYGMSPEKRPFLAGVDPSLLKKNDEIKNKELFADIIQMLYVTLELAAGRKDMPGLSIMKARTSDDALNKMVEFLPALEPMDYGKLETIYKAYAKALQSA